MARCFIELNKKGKMKSVNNTLLESLGYSLKEFLSLSVSDVLINLDDSGATPITVDQLLSIDQEDTSSWYLLTKDKICIAISIEANDLLGRNAKPESIVCSIQVLSRSMVKNLTDDEIGKLFRKAQSLLKLGFWNRSFDTEETYWSDELYTIFDIDPIEEPSFTLFLSRVHPDDQQMVTERFEAAKKQSQPFNIHFRTIDRLGRFHYLSGESLFTSDINGKSIRMFGAIQDVTELELKERSLQESQSKLNSILCTAADGIITASKKGIIESVNPAASTLFGYEEGELIGQELTCLMPDNIGKAHAGYMNQYLESGVANIIGVGRKVTGKKKSGDLFPLHLSLSETPIGDDVIFTGIVHDLTLSANLEQSLQDTANRLKSITDHAPAFIAYVDKNLKYQYVNELYYRHSEKKPEDFIGLPIGENDNPLSQEMSDQHIEKVLQGEYVEFETKGTDENERRYFSIKLVPDIKDGELHGFISLTSDITSQKLLQIELEKNKLKLLNVTEHIRHVLWMMSPDLNEMLYVSPAYEQIWGRTCESLYASPHQWVEPIHPDDKALVMQAFLKMSEVEFDMEYRIINDDQSITWIHDRGYHAKDPNGHVYCISGMAEDITERKAMEAQLKESENKYRTLVSNAQNYITIIDRDYIIQYANHTFETKGDGDKLIGTSIFQGLDSTDVEKSKRVYDEVFSSGKAGEFDYKPTPDDQESIFIHSTVTPLFEESGIPRLMILSHDLTGYKDIVNELKAAQQKTNETMAAKTRFLANISHEIRTPLNAIIGFNQVLQISELDDRQARSVNAIDKASKSLMELLNNLIDSAKLEGRKIQLEKIPFDLTQLLNDLFGIFHLMAEQKGITLNLNYSQSLPNYYLGDPGRISQVLTNLLSNAIKFTHNGKVELSVIEDNEANDIKFTVTDTGIGIKPENLNKVFDSFNQIEVDTSRKYGGSGLGTAIAKELVDLMEGTIWVESVYGAGSQFHFTIPLVKADL